MKVITAVVLVVLVSFVSCAQLPHIIFIVADDIGWNDMGWRNPLMHTPNLDRLARNGILLNNNYVQPLCSPSRSAFMSAYYPFHTGLQHRVIMWRQKVGLPLNLTTLPEGLKEQGYATHAVGKWHLGFCNWSYTPTERGFDSFLGFLAADEDYFYHDYEGGYDFRRNREVYRDVNGTYSAFVFADRALEILEEHDKSQPLFLYLPFQSVHFPLQVPVEYEQAYCCHVQDSKRRTYCGMVAVLDEAVGNITDKLEQLGYADNMLLVFTSDNGGEPVQGGNNWPLRGAKATLWEGGTRAASFLYSKNLFRKTGTVHNGMMHAVDWFPTLMTLVGGNIPEGIDGVSQWKSIVDGEESPRTEFVYNIDEIRKNAAIRVGDWKLIQGRPGDENGWYPPPEIGKDTARADENRNTSQDGVFRLFNVKDDPYEMVDLKDKNTTVLKRLKARLEQWRASLVPANYPPDDPAADPSNFGGVWSPGWC